MGFVLPFEGGPAAVPSFQEFAKTEANQNPGTHHWPGQSDVR